jgi:hypothetical protein
MKSVLIAVRLPEVLKKKAESKAKELGHIKPSGEANLSEYIRNLIINDRR